MSKRCGQAAYGRSAFAQLRGVLSNVSAFHGAGLYLLSDRGDTLRLAAVERPADGPPIPFSGVQRYGERYEILKFLGRELQLSAME